MFSYWEKQSLFNYDHIVIGAGIVGLSTAIELAERFPNQRILVLEKSMFPTGASTKNAGFACMGSVTELLADLKITSESDVVALYSHRKEGLEILRNRLGDENIGYKANGSYELLSENELYALEQIDYLNNLLQPITQKSAFTIAHKKINEFGFSTDFTKGLIENNCEGELHTGKMMRALADVAIERKIEIKTGANVLEFKEEADGVAVFVENNTFKEPIQLKCKTLSICTNAFTQQLLPGENIQPGRGQVLVTKPIKDLKLKGVFHFDEGYYYFREIDGRVLFGGGRNLDFEGETTTEFGLSQLIQDDLEQKLKAIILPYTSPEIDFRWSGIMAFGEDKQPVVKAISNRIFGAFRMGGMGVALGSKVARDLVQLITSNTIQN